MSPKFSAGFHNTRYGVPCATKDSITGGVTQKTHGEFFYPQVEKPWIKGESHA